MLDLVFGGRSLIFESPLSLEEATRRLEREIASPSARAEWRRAFESRPQSFIGTFADGRFEVVRLLHGRRSPMRIDGQLSRAADGCHVDVRMKMPAFASAAYIPFMVLGIFALLFNGLIVFWGLLAVVAPVVVWSHEAQKATKMLAALFESEPSRSITEGGIVRSW